MNFHPGVQLWTFWKSYYLPIYALFSFSYDLLYLPRYFHEWKYYQQLLGWLKSNVTWNFCEKIVYTHNAVCVDYETFPESTPTTYNKLCFSCFPIFNLFSLRSLQKLPRFSSSIILNTTYMFVEMKFNILFSLIFSQ